MKLLVFAHTPPPFHGQSYMVGLMLQGLQEQPQGEDKICCYHVDARFSRSLAEIGGLQPRKLFLLGKFVLQAVWLRVRHGVKAFYYVPAPPKKSALIRDWIILACCRPFFPCLILHWHATGLGGWLLGQPGWQRWISHRLLGQASLSIVLSSFNRTDAERFRPRQIALVNNGIPDPCPDYEQRINPRQQARLNFRTQLLAGKNPSPEATKEAGDEPVVFHALFLALCTEQKGLFDAIDGIILANRQLADQGCPIRIHLTVGGTFPEAGERARFEALAGSAAAGGAVTYRGFLSGPEKLAALAEADVFCFPTFYENENQPVNLIEAMAFGLPIIATRWRSIPEMFPEKYPGLVEAHSPHQIAEAFSSLMGHEDGPNFRAHFIKHFTLKNHLATLRGALLKADNSF